MKKAKLKCYPLYEPIFKIRLNVFIGGDEEGFLRKVESLTNVRMDRVAGLHETHGMFIVDNEFMFFWIENVNMVGVLLHECIHLVDSIFKEKGLTEIDTELRAYYTEWWFTNIYKLPNNILS